MSLWSHRELRVVICPDQVALLQVQRTQTLRGVRRTVHDAYSVPCDREAGAQPWRAALQALEAALPGYTGGKSAATVILSNHFMRYALVPWHAELADAGEELSFSRHCFARMYGEVAGQWDVRLSQEEPEAPRLASAVDTELLDALRGVFDGAGIALKSIQPHLMAAFNGFKGQLRLRSAWFALLEPGHLCLALLHHGHWVWVRNLRIGSTWREDLPLILEREACLADSPEVPHEVYVCDVGSDGSALPDIDSWVLHTLPNGQGPVEASAQDRLLAMAMAG